MSKKVVAAAVVGLFAGVTTHSVVKASPGDKNAQYKEDAPAADKHICKGANACKGKGGCGADKGKNECKGKGGCASADAKHECKGKNACKGLGGCGAEKGKNECKGKGGCAVPVKAEEKK